MIASRLIEHIGSELTVRWWLTLDPETLRAQDLGEFQQALRRLESETDWATTLDNLLDDHVAARNSAESLAAFPVVSIAGLLAAWSFLPSWCLLSGARMGST